MFLMKEIKRDSIAFDVHVRQLKTKKQTRKWK